MAKQATTRVPFRMTTIFGTVLVFVALALAFIPAIGPGLAHLVDRFRNRHNAGNELDARAQWYRFQVAKQLGMDPDKVTQKDLLLAAQLNPQLAKAVKDVYQSQGDSNRLSLYTTAGASAASLIPGGGAAVKMAASVGGAVGGGALATLMNSDRMNPQMVAEAINEHIAAMREKGGNPNQSAKPELVFMLRVAQNDAMAAEITQQFGKSFHKMTEAEQRVVMSNYPELAASSEAEAYAVASDMLPVQE